MKHQIGYCLMSKPARQNMWRGSCLVAGSYRLYPNRKDAEMAWQHGYEILEVYVDCPEAGGK